MGWSFLFGCSYLDLFVYTSSLMDTSPVVRVSIWRALRPSRYSTTSPPFSSISMARALMALSLRLGSVSYTHLDVYKRQGLGSQPPSPDWGLAISTGIKYISRAPWLSLFPGIALVYTTFGFNLIGEGLRDLLDPHMKSQ